MTDDCAEMIDNVQFVDDLEDETDLIDDIASDLLANVCCEWEKADQEYLGVSTSEDHHHYPDHQEVSLTIFEQMMTAEFWSLDQDEGESHDSGVFDMSNIYVPQDDDCEAGDMATIYVTQDDDVEDRDMSNIYVTQDDYGGDMNKEEIEAEFYELLQNMMHELSQVKTSPSLGLDAPVMAGYDEDRSGVSFHGRVFRATITDLSLGEFLVTFCVTLMTVMASRPRYPVTGVMWRHRRRGEEVGLQNVTFYDNFTELILSLITLLTRVTQWLCDLSDQMCMIGREVDSQEYSQT